MYTFLAIQRSIPLKPDRQTGPREGSRCIHRRRIGTGKLRLPKRSVVPGIDFLPTMAGQAKANAGRDVEVTWSDRGGARNSVLK
ncbi:unnamed protein product [Sphagnum balticum]